MERSNAIDYYKILGVFPQATQKEIKAAYKLMAKKWHPDKNTDRNTTVQMQLLSEAYSVLKDLEKRKRYNVEYYKFIFPNFQSKTHTEPASQSKTYTEPVIVRCYYCGENIANQKFEYTETLYKETDRSYILPRKVWYKSVEVKIPRCENCYKTHHSGAGIFILLPLVSFAVLGVILGLTIWGMWFLCLIGGIIVGVIFGCIVSSIEDFIIADEAGIKGESDIHGFGPLSQLLKDGWKTTKPEA